MRLKDFPYLPGCLVAGALLLSIQGAQAAFQPIATFDALQLGTIDAQDGWSASAGAGIVVLDPPALVNPVLEVNTDSGILYREAVVGEGLARTLFLRFRFLPHGRFSFGLSHLSTPSEYSDFRSELGMAAATANDPGDALRVANGEPTGTYDVVGSLLPDTWYNLWVHVDNSSGNYQVWLNDTPGSTAGPGDQLSNAELQSVFAFRSAGTGAIRNFYIKTSGGSSLIDGRFYIDDIFLENSDSVNLDNPLANSDSNGDGLADIDALALGLDPRDVDADSDDDGLSDVAETGGDPLAPQPIDNDGDGVIDAREPADAASDAAQAAGIALASGHTATIVALDGNALSAVTASRATPPDGVNFSFGVVAFSVDAGTSGSVPLRLTISEALPQALSVFMLGTDGTPVAVAEENWTAVDDRSLVITLLDGQAPLDRDGLPNGVIDAAIAIAGSDAGTAQVVVSSGGSGCSIGTGAGGGVHAAGDPLFGLLMAIAVLWLLHRGRHCASRRSIDAIAR